MCSKTAEVTSGSRGEEAFRQAFDRLKAGCPIRLKKGTIVSQNNVAKEAGRDPSALKKARYPLLVNEIQRWIHEYRNSISPLSGRQKAIAQRKKNQQLLDRIVELTSERDHCASLLVEADATILELVQKIARLEGHSSSTNVVEFNVPIRNHRD